MLRSIALFCSAPVLSALLAVAPCRAADEKPADLPLKKVVLFNSGVGFYEHRGEVTGNASLDLKFNVEDVNDLLKSMVPQDLDGGKVSTVTYGSMDPVTKTLQTFSIDLTKNPTMAQLLDQVRGEKAEIETSKTIAGTILGVERRKRAVKDEIFEEDFLNMLTADGLTSVPLSGVQRIRLTNQKLDGELRQALAILALAHDNDKKTVSLQFSGEGKRRVRVGYVQDAPIWKTSYRLVLGDEEPLLQGWAIVENTTEEDWSDVELSLVSGRPISFVMNLYQPLYIARPTVEPELFASLRPQTYGQDMAEKQREFAKRGADKQMDGLALRRNLQAPAAPAAAAAPAPPARGDDVQNFAFYVGEREQLGAGVQSAAAAANVGELFQYEIEEPVSIGRQKSAMLPIVAEKVKGDKVSIYNASVHAKHPLNGLRLTNSTKLHLMQGPITVFDDGAYAGDAQIEDLPAGSERLISYAMDLDTEVAATGKQLPSQLVGLKIVRGVLYSSNRLEREQDYVVKNSGKKTKQVLVEYPLETSWKLMAPEKPAEKTRDRYRFVVAAEPGKPAELKIREEQTVSTQVALTNLDLNQIVIYQRSKNVSDSVRSALEDVRSRQLKIADVRQQIARLEQRLKIVEQEQARIRQNMAQLERNSELYLRYVAKFTEQEDEVGRSREQIVKLQADADALARDLNDYLGALNVE